eukprot:Phypoly_transcript_02800.p1 GENE.Phypoly_transcript_02800~~Phypoly_transcript_02800.p1  ORF type:complete len:820 (+),score=244.36 Phypoly_transcript_02800:152-2611(+)
MPPTRKRKSLDTPKKDEEKEKEKEDEEEEKVDKEKLKQKTKVKEERKKKAKEKKKKSKVQESDEEVEEEKSTKKSTPKKGDNDGEEEEVASKAKSDKSEKKDEKEDENEKKKKEVLSKVVWEWAGDSKTGSQNKWVKYSDKVTLLLEEAFQNKEKEFKLDAERCVDLVNMLQRRYDDPNKRRVVQRFVPDLSISRSDVAMILSLYPSMELNKVLNALGQADLDTEEQKKWEAFTTTPNPPFVIDEVFKLASDRACINNMLKVPLVLNNFLWKKCMLQVLTMKHQAECKSTDYDHCKLSTFYNSKAVTYKRDHAKDDLDSRGNIKGDDYELGKDGAFSNFVAVVGFFTGTKDTKDTQDAQCANIVQILERKGFTVITCHDEDMLAYHLNFADVALLINCLPMSEELATKLLEFHKKGSGIGIFYSFIHVSSGHYPGLLSFLKHVKIEVDVYGPMALGKGTLKVDDATPHNLPNGSFSRHLVTSGINNLFAGKDQKNLSNCGEAVPFAKDSIGSIAMCCLDAKDNQGCLTGRIFLDGDISKFDENFKLAGIERFISNIIVWLVGLDAKLAHGVKMVGKITAQNFPTMPSYQLIKPPKPPSVFGAPLFSSSPFSSTPSSLSHTSLFTPSHTPSYSSAHTLSNPTLYAPYSTSSFPPTTSSYGTNLSSPYSSTNLSTTPFSLPGYSTNLSSYSTNLSSPYSTNLSSPYSTNLSSPYSTNVSSPHSTLSSPYSTNLSSPHSTLSSPYSTLSSPYSSLPSSSLYQGNFNSTTYPSLSSSPLPSLSSSTLPSSSLLSLASASSLQSLSSSPLPSSSQHNPNFPYQQ